MRRKNERAFNEIKNYYNDITLNNLAMISTLKEEIKSKEDKLERNEQMLATVQQENKKLAEPLKKAREQLAELQRQLGSQEKEKSALSTAQSKLKVATKQVENLTWETEVLQQKLDRALGKILKVLLINKRLFSNWSLNHNLSKLKYCCFWIIYLLVRFE